MAKKNKPEPATKKVLVLRTCASDGRSHGGFQWPESGAVKCTDWDPAPRCGNGLHGLLWGVGNSRLLSYAADARWLVVEVDAASVVEIDKEKVKFPRGVVTHCGDQRSATDYLLEHGAAGKPVTGAVVAAGYGGTATAGDGGTATAGHRGTAIAGELGTAAAGDGGTAIAGNWGTATAGDDGTATAGRMGTATAGRMGTATAGHRGTAIAGNWGTATAGNRGTAIAGNWGTAIAGELGTAAAGDGGTLSIRWWDGKRRRVTLGYVGEDGIKADTAYRCDESGKLVAVETAKEAAK